MFRSSAAQEGNDAMQPSVPRVDHASRRVEASPERVFEAFVEPEAIVEWLPPAGAHATLEAFDPRPGGAFRITLVFVDERGAAKGKTTETSDTVDGRFVELVAPRLIVQQFTFLSDDPDFAGTMKMTWSLAESDGGTLVSVAAEDVPRGISPDEHQIGLTSSLANLAAYVEHSRRSASS